ncbi:MAG TPA: RES family NAD+ phosphorylase [Polyangiaceae bacterium]|nr:RES family NAD+ phosphorylase [Polyangiaceae bacterium]
MISAEPPVVSLRWDKTYRLIPSRYPPIDLFERVADPADWELIAQLESLTNDRLRDEIGDIAILPVGERLAGPGASPIMAAFTHVGFASRFTDGSYGVYYASNSFVGALAEVLHHRATFLKRTAEPKTQFELRSYVGRLRAHVHDIRDGFPLEHDPDSYAHSQALAKKLRGAGSNGIVFNSVRCAAAGNVGIFRPSILAAASGKPHVTQAAHLRVEWDGSRMTRYIVMGDADWTAL